jgi:hypothetical protein
MRRRIRDAVICNDVLGGTALATQENLVRHFFATHDLA